MQPREEEALSLGKLYKIFKALVYFILLLPFYICFFSTFTLFHPLFLISLRTPFLNPQTVLVWLCRACHFVLFITTGSFVRKQSIALEGHEPIIILSNHQSAFDISSIILSFPDRKLYFVAKQELGRFIPSVSLLLREYNGILINRSDSRSSVETISKFLDMEKQVNLVIFPEGTRSRSGQLNSFKKKGFEVALKKMKKVQVVSFIFTKNYRFGSLRFFPFFIPSKMIFVDKWNFDVQSTDINGFIKAVFEKMERTYLSNLS